MAANPPIPILRDQSNFPGLSESNFPPSLTPTTTGRQEIALAMAVPMVGSLTETEEKRKTA
jgi:hypothetical protein